MTQKELKASWKKVTPKLKENSGNRTNVLHSEAKEKANALTMKELSELLKALKKK